DGQAVESSFVVDGLGQLDHRAVVPGEPGRINGDGAKGVAEEVTEEMTLPALASVKSGLCCIPRHRLPRFFSEKPFNRISSHPPTVGLGVVLCPPSVPRFSVCSPRILSCDPDTLPSSESTFGVPVSKLDSRSTPGVFYSIPDAVAARNGEQSQLPLAR